jgi:hypothetical protein
MDGPTSSYAAAGIALKFIGAHKPLTQQQSAFDKVETPSRGLLLLLTTTTTVTITNYYYYH